MTPTLNNKENSFDATHFSIAPNPVQDKQIHFSFSLEEIQKTTISIYDTLGRLVIEKSLSNGNIGVNYENLDVSDLQSGIYICKLATASNSKSLQVIVK
jgi:hypothetical protein